MASELTTVQKLRSPARAFYEATADNGALLDEAADALDAQAAEIARLREALSSLHSVAKPYATDTDPVWVLVLKQTDAALNEGTR